MSPGIPDAVLAGLVRRKARPPQSMHVITRSGSSTSLSLTRCVWSRESFAGRRIIAPAGTSTRPTTDRVREATFNALGSRDLVVGAQVADLFAGSGAIGIEALSRGAEHCTFVERDRDALRALRTNLDTLGLADRSRIVTGDVIAVAAAVDADLVFADPPYDFDAWDRLLGSLRAPFVVAESGRGARRADPDGPDRWCRPLSPTASRTGSRSPGRSDTAAPG